MSEFHEKSHDLGPRQENQYDLVLIPGLPDSVLSLFLSLLPPPLFFLRLIVGDITAGGEGSNPRRAPFSTPLEAPPAFFV
jgi:hypothetical protein